MNTHTQKIKEQVLKNKFNYMFLDRLKSDCLYFLGYGLFSPKRLHGENGKEHMAEMVKIWKSLPLKPEWLRAKDLIKLKNDMINRVSYLDDN